MKKFYEKGKEISKEFISQSKLKSKSTSKSILSKSKLNVVGENHTISGDRRAKEIVFCRETTGSSNYWLENEFKDKNTGKPADPCDLIMLQYIDLIEPIILETRSKTFVGSSQFGQLNKHLTSMITNFETQRQYFQNLQEDIAAFSKDIAALKQINNNVQEINKAQSLPADDDILSIINQIDEHIQSIKRIIQTQQLDLPTGSDNILKARSTSMHRAARESNEKGVWKVGDFHINDIKKEKKFAKEINYNLIDEKSFDEEYLEWDREHPTS